MSLLCSFELPNVIDKSVSISCHQIIADPLRDYENAVLSTIRIVTHSSRQFSWNEKHFSKSKKINSFCKALQIIRTISPWFWMGLYTAAPIVTFISFQFTEFFPLKNICTHVHHWPQILAFALHETSIWLFWVGQISKKFDGDGMQISPYTQNMAT